MGSDCWLQRSLPVRKRSLRGAPRSTRKPQMRELTYSYLLTAVVFSFVASGAYAAAAKSEPPTAADVEACWAKADADPSKENSCLKLDLAYAQSEYKTVTEQVASLAKAWDKPSGGRTRWNKFIVSGQSFDTFVKRECDFVSTVTKGSRLVEDNAELACQINWYRLRTSILTNRHLTEARH